MAPACVLCPQEKNIKHTGNISMDDIIEIARIMRPRSCAKELSGTCKEMLGTAVSVGCTVDHMTPSEVIDKVRTRSLACQRDAAGALSSVNAWSTQHCAVHAW